MLYQLAEEPREIFKAKNGFGSNLLLVINPSEIVQITPLSDALPDLQKNLKPKISQMST